NMLKTGARVFRLFTGYASATIDPGDGQAVDLLAEARQLTPAHEDFLAYYEHDSMKDVYMDGMESYTTSLMVNWGSLPDDLKTYETNLGDYLNQGFVACIMAADDADFAGEQERLISGLDAYRVDEIFQTYFDNANANSDDAQAIYDILDS
ncbi:MAG: hypothetical protein GX483_09205, partial [Actinomycetaceae bacterium]|nr:hypothetical protein [Actinomycetaceae bacterium]